MFNDLYVDTDGLIYVTDRIKRRAVRAGVYGAEDSVIIRAQKNEDLQEILSTSAGRQFFFPPRRGKIKMGVIRHC